MIDNVIRTIMDRLKIRLDLNDDGYDFVQEYCWELITDLANKDGKIPDVEYARLYKALEAEASKSLGIAKIAIELYNSGGGRGTVGHSRKAAPSRYSENEKASTRSRIVNLQPSDYEREAARAVLTQIISTMDNLPDVLAFRRRLPFGKVLSTDAGIEFTRSPLTTLFDYATLNAIGASATDTNYAIRVIPSDHFYRYEIALVKMSEFDEPIDSETRAIYELTKSVCVQHDAGDLLLLMEWSTHAGYQVVQGAYEVRSAIAGTRFQAERDYSEAGYDRRQRARRLFNFGSFGDEEGWHYSPFDMAVVQPFGFRNTVMGEALQIASDLAQTWHIPADNALTWLLTGNISFSTPVVARMSAVPIYENGKYVYSAYEGLTITAMPWVAPETIERQYKEAQRVVYAPVAGEDSKRLRTPSIETMRIYNFAHPLRSPKTGKPMDWSTIEADYIERYKSEAHAPTKRAGSGFSQQYSRAVDLLKERLLPYHAHATRNMQWRVKRHEDELSTNRRRKPQQP